MGWLSGLLRGRGPRAEGLNPLDDRYYAGPATVGGPALAGVTVTPETALRVSTVWGCVRLISESMASLPIHLLQKRQQGGWDPADGHPVAYLLRHEPNAHQTAFEWIEQMTTICLLRGRSYAEILPGPRGLVDQLLPLNPDEVTAELLSNGRFRYKVADQGVGRPPRVLTDDQVFDLRGLTLDGVNCVSVLTYARESIGLAIATERHGATFFTQSALPPLVIETPARLSDKAYERLRESWMERYSGAQNAHKPGILEEGSKAQVLGLSNEDAQFLQTREFQVVDIARWFRVPLHMIQETSKSTSWGTGIEQLSLAFVQFTLLPWVRRWEQAIQRDLILADQRYYAKFNVNALARGDQLSRYQAYQVGVNNGWLCPDDVRGLEDLNPLPDGQGQTFWMPANLQPVERALEEPEPAPPAPPPPGQGPDDEEEAAPEDDGGSQNGSAHYRALLEEAAGRVVRKELAALERAAKRGASGPEWERAVDEFYADHALFVAQTLRMPVERAAEYVAAQVMAAKQFGLHALKAGETFAVGVLCEFAATGGNQAMGGGHV